MTQTLTKFERFRTDFDAFKDRLGDEPGWLSAFRDKSMAHFEKLGLPTARRGNEPWKYTSIARIAETEFSEPESPPDLASLADSLKARAPWNDSWTNIVFVNGVFAFQLSTLRKDSGISVQGLGGAAQKNDEWLQQHLGRYADPETDAFVALNSAFMSDAAIVTVPDGAEISEPVNLIFATTVQSKPAIIHPRILFVAGKNSKVKVSESYVNLGEGVYLNNSVAEYVLEDGAVLEHVRVLYESDQAYNIGVVRAHQQDNSVFRSKSFQRSVGLGRYDLYNKIDGSWCESHQHGLYMTGGSQHVDNYINIDHTKPYSTSRLHYKGILSDRSRAVFGGTVWVREGAIKTDSKQEDRNLVLSPNAEVDSKPALFIWADDVLCGHGASAGNIDRDTVFYMRSRGIDLEEASRLLIYGFASEIIETVEDDGLRAYLEGLFLESLPTYRFEFE